jgi:hypothetical protein
MMLAASGDDAACAAGWHDTCSHHLCSDAWEAPTLQCSDSAAVCLAAAAEPPTGTAKAGSKRAKPEDATRNIATFVASHNWKDLAQGGGLAKLTVADLDMYLEYHKLKKTGNKGAKVDRIKEHLGL